MRKKTRLQGTPTKNPNTHQWSKLVQQVSIMILNCPTKTEIRRSNHSGDVLSVKESSNQIGPENFGAKTQEPDSKTGWKNCFYECLFICKKSAS